MFSGCETDGLMSNFPEIDYVINGEGERPLSRLVGYLQNAGGIDPPRPARDSAVAASGAPGCLHGYDQMADLAGLPPLLIQVGGDEALLSDAEEVALRATAAGVEVELEVWPGMFHVWQLTSRFIPEARQAIERIGAFLETRFTEGA